WLALLGGRSHGFACDRLGQRAVLYETAGNASDSGQVGSNYGVHGDPLWFCGDNFTAIVDYRPIVDKRSSSSTSWFSRLPSGGRTAQVPCRQSYGSQRFGAIGVREHLRWNPPRVGLPPSSPAGRRDARTRAA